MIKRVGYPKDPNAFREFLKQAFRHMPFRGIIAFMHSYILKLGFLDGQAGYDFATSRMRYYNMVAQELRAL